MRKSLLAILVSLCAASVIRAQDVHFSQFYYSPFTLNPALAGAMDGTFRFGGIYRNQWSSITSPFVYSTPSISGDVKLFSGGCNKNYLGVGLLLQNNRSGDGFLSNHSGMLSLAYHQALDAEGNYHLAAGMQGGIVQKSIDFRKLNPGPGVNPASFDSQISYLDVAAGVALFGVPNSHCSFQIGASVFHLNTPKESFFENSDNQVDRRYVAHGSLTLSTGKFYFFPSAQYQFQNSDQEFVYGSNFGFNINQSVGIPRIIYIGAFNRLHYNVIPTVGIMTKRIQAGLSYDLNISNDTQAITGTKGGFDIALSYMGNIRLPKHSRSLL